MNEENTEGLSLESKLSLIRGRAGGIKIKWLIHFIHFLPLKRGGGGVGGRCSSETGGFKDLSHILDIFFVVFIARVLAYYREPNNSVDSTFN